MHLNNCLYKPNLTKYEGSYGIFCFCYDVTVATQAFTLFSLVSRYVNVV